LFGAKETGDPDDGQVAQRVESLRLGGEDRLTRALCRILGRSVGGNSASWVQRLRHGLHGLSTVRLGAALLQRCVSRRGTLGDREHRTAKTSAVT
jgi:hypothetical protein